MSETRFVIDPAVLSQEGREAGERVSESINAAVAAVANRRAAEVERRILAGENRIEIPAGGFIGHREVYTVPTWRREPIKRLRVEWARWKAQRD